jgi:hypothetical protein
VFLPAMNADDFISSRWIAFQAIGWRTVWRVHVTCHVNPKPVGFISPPYSRKDSGPISNRSESFRRG